MSADGNQVFAAASNDLYYFSADSGALPVCRRSGRSCVVFHSALILGEHPILTCRQDLGLSLEQRRNSGCGYQQQWQCQVVGFERGGSLVHRQQLGKRLLVGPGVQAVD